MSYLFDHKCTLELKLKIFNQAKKSGTILYKVRQLFKGGNYSREETIKNNRSFLLRKLFKGGKYSREEIFRGNTVCTICDQENIPEIN